MGSIAPRRSPEISVGSIGPTVRGGNWAGARAGSAARPRFPASLAAARRAVLVAALPIGPLRRFAPARSAVRGKGPVEPVAWGATDPVGSAGRRRFLGRPALGLVGIVPADSAVELAPAGRRRSRGRSVEAIVPVGLAAVVSAGVTGRAWEGSRRSPRSRSPVEELARIAPAPVGRRRSLARSAAVGIGPVGSVAGIARPAPVA